MRKADPSSDHFYWGVALIAIKILVPVGCIENDHFGSLARAESTKLACEDQNQFAKSLASLVKARDDLLSQGVESQNKPFRSSIKQTGKITFADSDT